MLPITKEKYISFTKHVQDTAERADSRKYIKLLRFIDSFKFLSTILDKLSYFDKKKLKITQSEFCKLSAEDFDLLTRKAVFLYEYVDCVKKLEDAFIIA